MKTTPITFTKKTKTYTNKSGKRKTYVYYEAMCTVQAEKASWRETGSERPDSRPRRHYWKNLTKRR